MMYVPTYISLPSITEILLRKPTISIGMGEELDTISVQALYDHLREIANQNEVHIVSVTHGGLEHYVVNDYTTATPDDTRFSRVDEFRGIKNITFADVLHEKEGTLPQTSVLEYFDKLDFRATNQDAEFVFVYGANSGIEQMIAIHNTVLGSAVGGLREENYTKRGSYGGTKNQYLDRMAVDVLRLAEGMTKKGVMNETDSGGAKAVRNNYIPNKTEREDEGFMGMHNLQRSHANKELAAALNVINLLREQRGVEPYYTAEDMHTTTKDFDEMFEITPYVVCKSIENGGTGNPSEVTATTVVASAEEAGRRKFKDEPGFNEEHPLEGRVVLLEGAGACGSFVAKKLLDARAKVIATDTDESKLTKLRSEMGSTGNLETRFYNEEARSYDRWVFLRENQGDIYAPCAVGATINDETIPLLDANGVKVICGSANNQLADRDRDGIDLHNRGILYAVDWVSNGGGLDLAATERPGHERPREEIIKKAECQGEVMGKIFSISEAQNIPPLDAVIPLYKKRLAEAEQQLIA
jgi:leucine dehydrogenase